MNDCTKPTVYSLFFDLASIYAQNDILDQIKY